LWQAARVVVVVAGARRGAVVPALVLGLPVVAVRAGGAGVGEAVAGGADGAGGCSAANADPVSGGGAEVVEVDATVPVAGALVAVVAGRPVRTCSDEP
jgi:hypothetical protein